MIGGKLMRLSLMLVKSLVFNFLRERDRQFLVFPFFAPFLQFVCTRFARKNKKNEGKSENKCMQICIQQNKCLSLQCD